MATDLLDTLNDSQKEAVTFNEGPSLIIAGPGSGKTRALTHKIAYLIRSEGVHPNEVLAVTFTNKAASEMRERVIDLLRQNPPTKSAKKNDKNAKQGSDKKLSTNNGTKDVEDALDTNSDENDSSKQGDSDDDWNNDSSWSSNLDWGDAGAKFERKGLFDEPQLPEQLSSLNPQWIGTFHSLCAKILRDESEYLDVTKGFVIYDTDDSQKLIKEILNDLDLPPREFTPKSVLSIISRAKGEMMSPNDFDAKAQSFFYNRVAQIYPLYEVKLRDNNALDFTDLLYDTVKLFGRNSEVLEKYQNMFQYILVDEYQDTNKVQYQIVKRLAQKHRRITVVGDVSQSIYSWRGADYRNMMQFERDYPDLQTFKLAQNYRSTGTILKAAKTVIENNDTHIPLKLYTDNDMGVLIQLFEAEHERSEAQYVVDAIVQNAGSGERVEVYPDPQYQNFAVLYRTNAQSRQIEEAFIYAGIPYRIIGGVRFYDRREIKDVIAYLRAFHNPRDTVSWNRCINTPARGVGKKSLERIRDAEYDVEMIENLTKKKWAKYIIAAEKGEKSPLDLLDAVLKDFGYLEYLNDGTEESLGRIENLKELRTVARQFDTLTEFLEQIALVESSNKARLRDDNSVVLMTIHAAKGLEYDTVYMVGMEEGIFPHSRSMADEQELEEERRLCYVGITRAKKELHMTYTRSRTYFSSTGGSITSRFIGEIPEELIQFRFG